MEQVLHREYATGAQDHWWIRGRRAIFDRMLAERVPLGPGARILEIGPGHGVNLSILAPRGLVTTLDTDRESLAACLRRGAAGAVLADALRSPFAPASFDLVCALDVIEHLEDDASALRAIAALLKPGAKLLVSVPALSVLWGRQDVLSRHFRRYGRRELGQRVEGAGLEIEKLTFFNFALFAPILAVRLAMRPFLGKTTADGSGSDFSLRQPGPIETMLYRLFAAEAGWLVRHDLPLGVSLLCLATKPPAR